MAASARGRVAAMAAPAGLRLLSSSGHAARLQRRRVLELTLDALVVFNAALIGFELEGIAVNVGGLHVVICALYLVEMAARIYVDRRRFFRSYWASFELCVVVAACFGVFLLGGMLAVWLWRLTVLRVLRLARIWRFAVKWWPIRDLWLVLVGWAQTKKQLLVFAMVMFVMILGGAGAAMGFVDRKRGDFDGGCGRHAAERSECIDVEQYFGTLPLALLTMLQVVTLDGWAARVVRPLSGPRPLAAVAITVFAIFTAYGFVSILTGIIVRSTVDLARTHESHAFQVALTEDIEVVASLREKLEDILRFDERSKLDLRTLRDSMSVPEVKHAFDTLSLPLGVPDDLFMHCDQRSRGAITIQEFTEGVESLLRPTSGFDVCKLTATVGGSVTYCSRIDRRAQRCIDDMENLRQIWRESFAQLNMLAQPGGTDGSTDDRVPEVILRQAGRIYNPTPPGPPRYTR